MMGTKFGDKENPCLLSVRSGARASMPGMMDTVLNLGLNDVAVEGIAKKTGNERFAWDAYRRFIQMFGDVVMNVPHHDFEAILEKKKKSVKAKSDTDLSTQDLKDVVKQYKVIYRKVTRENFPDDAWTQLEKSINAVFISWNNDRAITYRKLNDIKGLIGT